MSKQRSISITLASFSKGLVSVLAQNGPGAGTPAGRYVSAWIRPPSQVTRQSQAKVPTRMPDSRSPPTMPRSIGHQSGLSAAVQVPAA